MTKSKKDLKEEKRKQALEEEQERIKSLLLNDKISPIIQEEMVERVLYDVKQDEADKAGYIKEIVKIWEAYEGKRSGEAKTDPFEGCADVKTMVVAMVIELLHSKLFPACYSENLTYWVPQEASDISTADGVSKFMKWATRKASFSQVVDDTVKNACVEGTMVCKICWIEKWRWVQRRIPKFERFKKKLTSSVLGALGGGKKAGLDEQDYDIEYEYRKFEYAKPELIPLEDVGFPLYSIPGGDENELDHIWHRTRPALREVKEKEIQGYYMNTSNIEGSVENKLREEGKIQKVKQEAEGSTSINIEDRVAKESAPLERIEWYGRYDIPEMGYIECVIWVEKSTKTFLGAIPLVKLDRNEQRPFVIGQLIRRPHRLIGKGMGSLVFELEEEMNTIHDQRLDAGTISIMPPGFYRAASGFEPEEIKLKPTLMVPVDDINDVKWLTIPNNVFVSFQEEKMIMELIEKLTSTGSYQSGQESDIIRSRATAKGTMAIIAQGEQRHSILAKRIQSFLARVLGLMLKKYQQNIPPGMAERVLNEKGESVFPKGFSPKDIMGDFDVYMLLDSTGGSKDMQRQLSMLRYETMLNNPMVQANPQGFWEISSDLLKSTGTLDVERIIGPRPEGQAKGVSELIKEELSQIKQGRLPVSEKGTNIMGLVLGYTQFMTSPDFAELSQEQQALVKGRLHNIQLELVEKTKSGELDARQGPSPVEPGGPVLERPNPSGPPEAVPPKEPGPGGPGPIGAIR